MLNVPLIYKYQFCGCQHGRVEVFQHYASPLKLPDTQSLIILILHFIDWNTLQKTPHFHSSWCCGKGEQHYGCPLGQIYKKTSSPCDFTDALTDANLASCSSRILQTPSLHSEAFQWMKQKCSGIVERHYRLPSGSLVTCMTAAPGGSDDIQHLSEAINIISKGGGEYNVSRNESHILNMASNKRGTRFGFEYQANVTF